MEVDIGTSRGSNTDQKCLFCLHAISVEAVQWSRPHFVIVSNKQLKDKMLMETFSYGVL